MRIKGIHHVTVAVRDVEAARATFEALLDAAAGDAASVPLFGVRTRDLTIGAAMLQLASPLDAENPVTRFLERKGEGFYNLALEVDDLDAIVADLTERGIRISTPVEATPGLRSSFITMSATHGLSVQLVEVVDATRADDKPDVGEPLEVSQAEQPLDLTPDEWSDVE
ncbi:MAG TPA: VOC family protein [Dehalococcoidia bacterium]